MHAYFVFASWEEEDQLVLGNPADPIALRSTHAISLEEHVSLFDISIILW